MKHARTLPGLTAPAGPGYARAAGKRRRGVSGMGRKADPKPRRLAVTRHYGPDGKRCKASDPGAVARRELTESYYYVPPRKRGESKRAIPLGTSDVQVAWERLRVMLRRQLETAAGIRSPLLDQAERPLSEHLAEWLAYLRGGKRRPHDVDTIEGRMGRLVQRAGWQRIGQIDRPNCSAALQAMRKPTKAGGLNLSAQTSNHYLSHARQFCGWLVAEGRLQGNPLDDLTPLPTEGEQRHARRCPDDEEVRLLFEHLGSPSAKVRVRLAGPARALLYSVAMCTGFRAGELRALTVESFDRGARTLRIPARKSKRRKKDVIPLPSWLAEQLAGWLDSGGVLFGHLPADGPGRALEADLALARKLWVASAEGVERAAREKSPTLRRVVPTLDGPAYWDFHSLRHYYVTQLASQDGITPATLQTLSRHSDPRLTLQRYSHGKRGAEATAADRLRVPGAG